MEPIDGRFNLARAQRLVRCRCEPIRSTEWIVRESLDGVGCGKFLMDDSIGGTREHFVEPPEQDVADAVFLAAVFWIGQPTPRVVVVDGRDGADRLTIGCEVGGHLAVVDERESAASEPRRRCVTKVSSVSMSVPSMIVE